MPNPLPQDASRLDAVLERANRLRKNAHEAREKAADTRTDTWAMLEALDAAEAWDAEANKIMAAMKEGNGHG